MKYWLLFWSVLSLMGCAEAEVIPLVVSEREGDEAEVYGVGLLERTFRVRVDETVSAQIYLPLAPGEETLASGGFPVVLSVHGGLVASEQYEWMNVHLASRGVAVIAPRHAFDLAIFEQGNALDVLRAARRAATREKDVLYGRLDEGAVMAIGHSLGGVVAARAWVDAPDEVTHLVLLASIPNPSDPIEARADSDAFVLSITGERDGRISVAEVAEGAERFAAPTTMAVIEGMNHFQWVDGATAAQWESDDPATIDVGEARQRVVRLLDEAVHSFVSGDREYWNDLDRWPAGVTLHEP